MIENSLKSKEEILKNLEEAQKGTFKEFNENHSRIKEAIMDSKKLDDHRLIAISYKAMSSNYYKISDFKNALDYSIKALYEFQNYKIQDANLHNSILNNLSLINYQLGDYKFAISQILQAYDVLSEKKRDFSSAFAINNFVAIYHAVLSQNDYEEVLSHLKIELMNLKKDENIDLIKELVYLGKSDDRVILLIDLLKNSDKIENSLEGTVSTNLNISHLLKDFKKYDEAMEYINKCIELEKKLNKPSLRNNIYSEKAEHYYSTGKLKKAEKLIDSCLKSIDVNDDIGKISIYKLGYKIYKKMQNFEKALECYEYFSNLDDKLQKGNFNRSMLEISAKYKLQKKINETQKAHNNAMIFKLKNEKLSGLVEEKTLKIVKMTKFFEVGRITSSIVHNLKNPLSALKGIGDLLENSHPNQEKLIKYSGLIRRAVDDMVEMMNSVKYKVRKEDSGKIEKIKMNEIIKEVISFKKLDMEFKNKYNVVLDFEKNIPIILGEKIHFKQIIGNLINNAVDAMQESIEKKIIIRTYFADMLYVEISDTGKGIEKNIIKKIFEYNFTTKSFISGTGLGLGITKDMIKAYNGDIKVDSEVGKGTTFKISIPS